MTCGVPRWKRNVAQRGDAFDLLTSLPDACAALAFFDPQHRGVLDKLAFGNEGARQRERCCLACDGRGLHRCLLPRDRARAGAERLLHALARHLWALRGPSPGRRRLPEIRRSHCLGQLAPRHGQALAAARRLSAGAATAARDRDELARPRHFEQMGREVNRKIHPHAKPVDLIERLIAAVTLPGDLVIDPAAGGFGVLHAALRLGRQSIGCDAVAPAIAITNFPKSAAAPPVPRWTP